MLGHRFSGHRDTGTLSPGAVSQLRVSSGSQQWSDDARDQLRPVWVRVFHCCTAINVQHQTNNCFLGCSKLVRSSFRVVERLDCLMDASHAKHRTVKLLLVRRSSDWDDQSSRTSCIALRGVRLCFSSLCCCGTKPSDTCLTEGAEMTQQFCLQFCS